MIAGDMLEASRGGGHSACRIIWHSAGPASGHPRTVQGYGATPFWDGHLRGVGWGGVDTVVACTRDADLVGDSVVWT